VRGEMGPERLRELEGRVAGITLIAAADGAYSFAARDAAACSGLVRELFSSSTRVEDLRVQEPTLQSLFLKLTGKELRD